MNFIDWLTFTITISRRLTNAYYIIMFIIPLIAIIIAYRMKFKRFSFYLWLVSGLICLFWETFLFATGARGYHFSPALELLYHALTEAGPGLIIMILFAHKIKLIDISEYADDFKRPMRMRAKSKGKGKVKAKAIAKPKSEPGPEDANLDDEE